MNTSENTNSKQKENVAHTNIICVVPLYNPKQDEIANIDSYIDRLDYCILMDDSPNTQEAVCEELLTKHKGKIEYIWNEKNIGLCKSANNGIRRAVELEAQWILIMNPDSKMHNDIISVFRDYIEKNNTDNIAILAPRYNYDRHKRKAASGSKKIKFSNMSGSLFNSKVISHIGDYDERFFVDGLDIEWCLRALKAGYDIVECSEAVLDHHPAETKELKLFGKAVFRYGQDSPSRYYYQFRAMYLNHSLYHDLGTDLFGLYKILKTMVLFENKAAYKKVRLQAKADYRRGYFDRYIG